MRLALQIPHFYSAPARQLGAWLIDIATAAEKAGLHSIWLMDHLFQLGNFDWLSPVESPMLEGYSTLGFIGARTRTLELGLLVTPATYRPPGLLLKTVSTLDVLTGGRMWLGLGAGWYEAEAHGLGLPLPPLGERFAYLEDTLRLARQVWEGSDETFIGAQIRLERPLNEPGPIRIGGPPIMVGGAGRRRTLRLAARYADGSNIPGTYYASDRFISESFDALRRHCVAVGRDPDAVARTVLDTFDLSSNDATTAMVRRCRSLARLGVEMVIFNIPHPFTADTIARVGCDVVPELAD